MSSEQKLRDDSVAPSSSEHSSKSEDDVQESSCACVDVVAGIKSLSVIKDEHQGEADANVELSLELELEKAGLDNNETVEEPTVAAQHSNEKETPSDLLSQSSLNCRVPLEKAGLDNNETVEEPTVAAQHSNEKETPSDLSSQSALCRVTEASEDTHSLSEGSENEGFPETGHGFSLESYLSDFKSSSSNSDFGFLEMSESCIDGFLGKLDSDVTYTAPPQHKQEEVMEDNRCPSTFFVSAREDSWPFQCDVKEEFLSTVSQREDSQPGPDHAVVSRETDETELEQMQPKQTGEKREDFEHCFKQEHLCEENKGLGPPQEGNKDTENHGEVFEGSVRKGECVLHDSTLGFKTKTKAPEISQMGAVCNLRQTPSSFSPSLPQIISEEHHQALQLLGLTDCPTDSKDQAGNRSLNTYSLSDDSSFLGQTFANRTKTSSHCPRDQQETDTVLQETDTVLKESDITFFVSDCLDENIHVSTEMESRPPVHDPDYVKDGYVFRIEENLPSVHSDCESDVSVESPQHTPPPIPCSLMPPGEEQAKREQGISNEKSPAKPSVANVPMEKFSLEDQHAVCHEITENLDCSLTDFSIVGLPSQITARESEIQKENSAVSERHESPKGEGFRPVPTPRRKKVNETGLTMSQGDADYAENQETGRPEEQRKASSYAAKDCFKPPQVQNTGSTSGRFSPSVNSNVDLFTVEPTLELSPIPCKKNQQQSDDMELPSQSPQNFAYAGIPTDRLVLHAGSSQHVVSCFSELDQAGSVIPASNPNLESKGMRYKTDSGLAKPRQGSQVPSSSQRTQYYPENHCVFQGNQRAESHVPGSSVQTASPQSSGPCVSAPPPSDRSGKDQRMAADADIKTVMVTGSSLDKDQKELCELYFENKKRSDGGEISEEGIVWSEERKCFFVTFMESYIAKRVASKEHSLKGCPVQVQLWSPERISCGQSAEEIQKDRVLVSGFPPETTSDLLQNYLECSLNVEVASVEVNRNNGTSLIIFEAPTENIGIEEMERACQSSPLDEGVRLSFRGVPVPSQKAPATNTVLVEGLGPETVKEALQYFFSNKRRNAGGPVKKVDRISATTALVHFKNAEDAASVVKKGNHKLDEHILTVSLHEAFVDSTGQWPPPQAAPSTSRFTGPREETRSGTGHQQPGSAHVAGNAQALHSSPGGGGFTGNHYSSSASAQVRHGGPGYDPSFQSRPPYSGPTDSHSFPDSEAGRNPQLQTSMASGVGGHRETKSSGMGAYREQLASGVGAYKEPQSGMGAHKFGATSSALISSSNHQPKDKDNFGAGSALPRSQRNPKTGERFGGPGSDDRIPPAPGFRPEVVRAGLPSKTFELGSDVVLKIKQDNALLRKLIQELKFIECQYRWDHPDFIVVTYFGKEVQNWERKVADVMDEFRKLSRQQLERDREPARLKLVAEAGSAERMDQTPVSGPEMVAMSPSPNTLSTASVGMAKPPLLGNAEDTISNLKPAQLKILRMPKPLEKLKRGYPGLEISVDEKEKTATVMAPEDLMIKAFTDVLSFVTGLGELKLPLSHAVARMYKKKDGAEWIQRTLIDKYELVCDWEAKDDHVILYGQGSDLRRFQSMFQTAFLESTMPLIEKEACVLKSPAWISFQEKMQEMKKDESPTPVLLPEKKKIIIVDTPSSISQTRMALRNFLDNNKLEKVELQISPGQVKFLQLHCKEETKSILQKARDVGVTVNFTTNSVVTEGPKGSLADAVGRVKELMGRIKEDKMTFKKPGVATYLTGPKGQEFLSQTGTATGCYITTSSSGAGGDRGDDSNTTEGQVLAEINLNATHQVLIMQGDITQCRVEAIVNAANVDLKHDGGVAAAISKAGGRTIQEESDEIVADGRLMEGEVAVTRAGSLPCSHILHAVGPIWSNGKRGEEEILTRTVKVTLKKAESMKLTSVAMPAISCGIFRYPVEEATSTIINAIFQHFKEVGANTCLTKLILIDMGADPLRGLLKAARVRFNQCIDIKGEPKAPRGSGKQGGSSEYRSDRDSNSDHGHGGKSQAPIKIIAGEIARSKADVIVCTTHPSLDLRKGVLSKSILERGGEAIQQDLKKYLERNGPPGIGQVVWTSGGDLDCKAVYHLSLPTWRDDHGQKMRSVVRDCLDTAIRKNARSIAFPTLGTGRLGYPGDKVASIMFSAIGEWFQKNPRTSMKEVQIIIFNQDTDMLEAFKAAERHGGRGHRSNSSSSDRHSGRGEGGHGGDGRHGSHNKHGSDRYSGDRHGSDRYSGDRHGSDRYSGDRHGSDRYSGDRHGSDRYSGDRHGSDRYSGDRHGRHGGGGGHRGDRHGDSGRHGGGGGANGLKTRVGKVTVMVKEGNILQEPCDAIVNTTNDNLDLTFGALSKEISKACGSDLAAECRAQRDKMAETGVAITKVESSNLSCGSVVHISADRFKQDWQEGILSLLQAADKDRIKSIALPALGTGGRGADPSALAEAMQRAVSQFSDRARSLQEVRVVVFQKQLLAPYMAAFDPGAASGGEDHSDTSEGHKRPDHSKKNWHGIDVYIYATLASAIKEAREKIFRHLEHVCTSHTESNPLIANFNHKQTEELFKLQNKHSVEITLDQKKSTVIIKGVDINVAKAVSDLKDIILSATKERHLAAGMPPVRWQYETGKDKFSDFDQELVLHIEAAFKKKEREVYFSDKRSRKYKIVFKDRKEYPIDPQGHPVTVRRRDMLDEKQQEIPLPSHWAPMKGEKVKRVDLKPDSSEYKKVAAHFGAQAQIKKIERIQNPTLFQQFKVKKKELEQYNPKGTENEKRLFHGTPSDSVESIITNGFNRNFCGRHGTALGTGVYFAADSATSMGYASGGNMFQARVLVGEYTPGNSSMRMAPNKANSIRPYDSVSNAPQNASVFVIFHDSQAYPEYLITF